MVGSSAAQADRASPFRTAGTVDTLLAETRGDSSTRIAAGRLTSDTNPDLALVTREKGQAVLYVADIAMNQMLWRLELGPTSIAGLSSANLDADLADELLVITGSRFRGRVRQGAILAGALAAAVVTAPVALVPMLKAPTSARTILALDSDGSELWRRDLASEEQSKHWKDARFLGAATTRTAGRALMFYDTASSMLMSLSGATGQPHWVTTVDGGFLGRPQLAHSSNHETLVVAQADRANTLIDVDSGERTTHQHGSIWREQIIDAPGFKIDDRPHFIAYNRSDDALVVRNGRTGKASWTVPLKDFRGAMTGSNRLYAMGGKQLHEFLPDGTHVQTIHLQSLPVFARTADLNGDGRNEILYSGGMSSTALHNDGSQIWRQGLGSAGYTEPPCADLDGDGWLDIPVRQSKTGWIVSGRSGKRLVRSLKIHIAPLCLAVDGTQHLLWGGHFARTGVAAKAQAQIDE